MPRKKSEQEFDVRSQCIALLNHHIDTHKMRHTPERMSVLEAVLDLNERFTIETLVHKVQQNSVKVSRGTIVNTVNLLKELGILVSGGTNRRFAIYQLAPRAKKHSINSRIPFHIHLQCNTCGGLKEVHDTTSTLALSSRRYGAFIPVGGIITIYGQCRKCSSNSHSKNKK